MPTLLEKKQRRSTILSELKVLRDSAKLTNRSLSAEEQTKFDSLLSDDATLKGEIATEEANENRLSAIGTLETELGAVPPRRTQPDTLGGPKVVKENVLDDPKKGFKTPREFMLSVLDAGMGRKVDKRLEMLTVGSDEGRGNSDPAGGFLIPQGFSPDLLKITAENDPTAGLTTKLPMDRPIVKIPARVDTNHTSSVSGGLTFTRRPETVAATSSQLTMSQVTMEAHTLMGLSYATEELLVDSPTSFAALLTACFGEQYAGHMLNERLNGTGVGEFTGIVNAACVVSQAKETGQAAATIQYENVLKMRSRCWGYASAVWLSNHDCMPQLMLMNQSVGVGGLPVWQPSAREDHPDILLGRPLVFTEFCQTVGTVGDLVLGNWSQYLEGTYQPMQSAESMHVRFVNHERTFKFWTRNAGQPWWKAALTPAKSTTTLSPFVTLATRA